MPPAAAACRKSSSSPRPRTSSIHCGAPAPASATVQPPALTAHGALRLVFSTTRPGAAATSSKIGSWSTEPASAVRMSSTRSSRSGPPTCPRPGRRRCRRRRRPARSGPRAGPPRGSRATAARPPPSRGRQASRSRRGARRGRSGPPRAGRRRSSRPAAGLAACRAPRGRSTRRPSGSRAAGGRTRGQCWPRPGSWSAPRAGPAAPALNHRTGGAPGEHCAGARRARAASGPATRSAGHRVRSAARRQRVVWYAGRRCVRRVDGRVRHAWNAATSASAATALPKTSKVGRSPSETTTRPPAIAGRDSAA
jgi:hypothetical protein